MKKTKIWLMMTSSIMMVGGLGGILLTTTSCGSEPVIPEPIAPTEIELKEGVTFFQAIYGTAESALIPWSIKASPEDSDVRVNWTVTLAESGEPAPAWIYVNSDNYLCVMDTTTESDIGTYEVIVTATAVKASGVKTSSVKIIFEIVSPNEHFYYDQLADGTLTVIGDGLDNSNTIPIVYKSMDITEITHVNGTFTTLLIPASIRKINDGAFQDCSTLTNIIIPNTVTSLGSSAFKNCTNLESITLSNVLTSIKDNTFYACTSLTDITIPNSVTSVGIAAFQNCSGLKDIIIPESVNILGSSSFSGCSALITATINSGLNVIEAYTFSDCVSLTTVIIPNTVTSIDKFAFQNCPGLISITMECATPPTLGLNVFMNIGPNYKIYVPADALFAYQNAIKATGWTDDIKSHLTSL